MLKKNYSALKPWSLASHLKSTMTVKTTGSKLETQNKKALPVNSLIAELEYLVSGPGDDAGDIN